MDSELTLERRRYADQIMDWLVELGYTHCFFVAGGNIMHLLDAARLRMSCIPVVHEVSAGIAAEYFNETSTAERAFALVTAGPGVTNILTAMSGAWLESRELLVLAGQVKSTDLARGLVRQRGIQEIDGVSLAKPISKHAMRIEQPINQEDFNTLVKLASSGRPGPVFIEFCLDAQGANSIVDTFDCRGIQKPLGEPSSLSAIETIQTLLARCERPILLVGGGVSRKLMTELRDHPNFLKLPMMTTWNGADRLDSDDYNYLGRPNTWGQRAANLILAQSDLIVALGTRLGLQQTGFNWQEFGKNAIVCQVDIDPNELVKGHPRVDEPFCCDANEVLEAIVESTGQSFEKWTEYAHYVREILPLNDAANRTSDGFVCPYSFFLRLSELAQRQDIIVPCSSGGANSVAMQAIRQKFGQFVVTNKGLASMGYGLAGAIGASFANPNRRIILIEGDGGFAQNLQEIATVDVNQLNILIFIFANNGYGSIRTTQRNYFDGAYLGCDTQTGLGFPNWRILFESFGIELHELTQDWAEELDSIMKIQSGPIACLVPIDPEQTYWPKITSQITDTGSMESRALYDMSPDLPPQIRALVSRFL